MHPQHSAHPHMQCMPSRNTLQTMQVCGAMRLSPDARQQHILLGQLRRYLHALPGSCARGLWLVILVDALQGAPRLPVLPPTPVRARDACACQACELPSHMHQYHLHRRRDFAALKVSMLMEDRLCLAVQRLSWPWPCLPLDRAILQQRRRLCGRCRGRPQGCCLLACVLRGRCMQRYLYASAP